MRSRSTRSGSGDTTTSPAGANAPGVYPAASNSNSGSSSHGLGLSSGLSSGSVSLSHLKTDADIAAPAPASSLMSSTTVSHQGGGKHNNTHQGSLSSTRQGESGDSSPGTGTGLDHASHRGGSSSSASSGSAQPPQSPSTRAGRRLFARSNSRSASSGDSRRDSRSSRRRGAINSACLGALPWKRRVADKLNLRWRVLGACGVFCLVASTLALIGLTNPNLFFSTSRGQRSAGDSLAPQWFDNRGVPRIIVDYVDLHQRAINDPTSSNSKFLVHEIPSNETQVVDALLGLVSSFLLAIITDRALLVEWTDKWATPLDQLSLLGSQITADLDSASGIWPDLENENPSVGSGWDASGWGLGAFGMKSTANTGNTGSTGSSSDGMSSSLSGDGTTADGSSTSSSYPWANASATVYSAHVLKTVISSSVEQRRVSLAHVLSEPGFKWSYAELAAKYSKKSKDGKTFPVSVPWDPLESIEDVTCKDLKKVLGSDNRFVKVNANNGRAYYLPLLLANPFYSTSLAAAFEGGATWAFADLLNFLVRPVSEVLEAVDRFKVRYMDGNTVIGMEMSVMPGAGDWSGEGLMPQAQQSAFFTAASKLVQQDDTLGGSKGGVFLLVTDNQAQVQARLHELEAADELKGAGVVAVLAASGDGPARVHLELQELWLLGLTDTAVTTPGSRLGVVGAARTRRAPVVVMSADAVHQSSAPYPCFSRFGAVQQTTCFEPAMLGIAPPDTLVPC